MEAKSTDKKSFQLTENGRLLGEIKYENLFFLKAEIKLSDFDVYQIASKGIFGTSISVKKDDIEIANLVMNWNGQIVIKIQNDQEYIIKLSGLFSNKYIIENKNGDNLIQLEAQFNWREFHYNYDITYAITDDNASRNAILLLLGVYAANYFIATMSGANAGMI